jgi:hypothetical protein
MGGYGVGGGAILCLRTRFGVPDPARAADVKVTVEYLGGVVVCVNGVEVGRSHVPAGKLEPHIPAADYPIEAYTVDDGGTPLPVVGNRYARAKNRKPGKNDAVPDEGEVFHFRPTYPKWTTVDAEFRDANGKYWPSFCYGKPVSGQIKWEGGRPQGAFEVACTAWCQTEGDQSQRVLAPLIRPPKDALPKVTLRVTALGPLQTREVPVDVNGKTEMRELVVSEATGELEVGGKVIKVRPQCVITVGKAVESAIRKTQINAGVTVKDQDLGLTGDRANVDIDVRVGAQAHAGDVPPSRR